MNWLVGGIVLKLLADILENTEYDFCIKKFNYLEMKEKL